MRALILTGWGWREYPVAAAAVLRALGGRAAAALKCSRNTARKYLD